jgi:hypothetical protein
MDRGTEEHGDRRGEGQVTLGLSQADGEDGEL